MTTTTDVSSADTSIFTRMGESLSSVCTSSFNALSDTTSSLYQKATEGMSFAASESCEMGNKAVKYCSDLYSANPKVTIAALSTIVAVGTGVALYTFRDRLPDCVQNMIPGKNQGS